MKMKFMCVKITLLFTETGSLTMIENGTFLTMKYQVNAIRNRTNNHIKCTFQYPTPRFTTLILEGCRARTIYHVRF